MAFKIKIADTTALIDKVFRLRHQVFVEEEKSLEKTAEGRIVDRFDAYPTTSNLILLEDEKVIGSFRLSLDSSEGLPADQYFDFRKHTPKDAKLMHASIFCITKEHRNTKLTMGLILMAAYFAVSNDVTHVLAPINPAIAKLLKRIGFYSVGEQFTYTPLNFDLVPLVMRVSELNDFFLNFIRKNQLQDFLINYENWFYRSGEQIIKAGTVGEEAYILIEGEVRVEVPESDRVISKLGPGAIIGELALLTDQPRSADIFAITEVRMMVLSKKVFIDRFMNSPEESLKLTRTLAQRTQSLIGQLAGLPN